MNKKLIAQVPEGSPIDVLMKRWHNGGDCEPVHAFWAALWWCGSELENTISFRSLSMSAPLLSLKFNCVLLNEFDACAATTLIRCVVRGDDDDRYVSLAASTYDVERGKDPKIYYATVTDAAIRFDPVKSSNEYIGSYICVPTDTKAVTHKLYQLGDYEDALIDLRAKNAPVYIGPQAFQLLNAFKMSWKPTTEPYMVSMRPYMEDYILRIAAILALNEGVTAMTQDHMKAAIMLVDEAVTECSNLFLHGYRKDKCVAAVERIFETLIDTRSVPIRLHTLGKKTDHLIDRELFNFIVDVMHELQFVKVYQASRQTIGKPTTYVQATDHLVSMSQVAQVLGGFDVSKW